MINLKDYHTFHCAAYASSVTEISSIDQAKELIGSGSLQSEKSLLLGGGSNVLFVSEQVKSVFLNRIKERTWDVDNEGRIVATFGGGEIWHEVVRWSLDVGLNGIENLALIPGTCGAAPIQNIGAYGVELKDVFHSLRAIDRTSGEELTFFKDECRFGYRDSIFKQKLKNQLLITHISLVLQRNDAINSSYGNIEKQLLEMDRAQPWTAFDIFDAVVAVRSSKLPDPAKLGNAGSFFKNPVIHTSMYMDLKEKFPDIPGYPVNEYEVKVPAAFLIEYCGFKGFRIGNVGCYEKQPLVLVNYDEALGTEIKALAETIQDKVKTTFGIMILPEVNFI